MLSRFASVFGGQKKGDNMSLQQPAAREPKGTHPKQKPDWANLEVIHRNTLPPRSHFFLYDTEKDAISRDVTKAKAHCLSGKWKFNLVNSPFEAPEDLSSMLLDNNLDTATWSDINVPGMWQMQGFGRGPHYTNVQYPFFVDPPYPPFANNECGSYITSFNVPERLKGDQLRLRFEGVDSSFHVWVNGHAVGYSQGRSRNPSEFDITEYTKIDEQNTLAVRVYQFCDGSYIEDQDQWWLSGIFRDVYLLGFPQKAHFEDLTVHTILDDKYRDAKLEVKVTATGHGTIKLRLLDAAQNEGYRAQDRECLTISDAFQVANDSKTAKETGSQTLEFSLPITNPHKWTAETPYLYTLVVSLDDAQYMAHRVGFRQVEMKDGLITINGKPLVFKGANRHEHHPESGRTVPYEFLRHDLVLMKTHNINAIRTCHQPNDPQLYDLADELGFWVMDEADLECHGFEYVADAALPAHERDLPFAERQKITRRSAADWTSDNPDWREAYVDRAKQVVHRDQLHPCVVMWSLGNEAFYGRNHTAMVEWIKSYDSSRPIHYEPDDDAKHVDLNSWMYASVDDIIAFAMDKSKTKPLVLCEYIHAMGTGPGNIKEYIDAFYKYPTLQGGWVWEWANHGLLTKTKEGIPFYAYGGDFGDVPNDGNFVMDGVLQSDHTPNSGLIEYKKALEPVQVLSSSAKSVKIINRLDFATLDHLECVWLISDEKGPRAESGNIEIPSGVQPGATAELALPKLPKDLTGEAFLDISFRLKDKTAWADAGYELAWGQIPLQTGAKSSAPSLQGKDELVCKAEKSAAVLSIVGGVSTWEVNIAEGTLCSWKKGGKEVMVHSLEPTFYRAVTDNDAPRDGREWKERQLHLACMNTRSVKWYEKDGCVIVEVNQKFAPPVLSWSLDLTSKYTFRPDGRFEICIKGDPAGLNLPTTLPRLGVTFGLLKGFQEIKWFGRGPGESYKDMKLSQRIALHSVSAVDNLWTAPEFPQECSNRTDTRWLNVSDGTTSIHAQFFDPTNSESRKTFDFMACHYDVKDIDDARHPYELETKKKDLVILRLDADHHGLGTGSCGPKTLEQYALKTKPFSFGITLY